MFSGFPFFRRAKQRNRPHSRFDHGSRPRKLRLESLEDRRLLATFLESGAILNLGLGNQEHVSIVSTSANTYTFTLNPGSSWTGSNSDNVLVAGATPNLLTVTTAGKSVFTTIEITDSAAGGAVTFNNSSTIRTYAANFNVVLDDTSAGPITFHGNSDFSGRNLSASTTNNIVINSGANVSSSGGSISLNASAAEIQNRGRIFVGSGSVTMTADKIDLQDRITANGGITLQPASPSRTIALNAPLDPLDPFKDLDLTAAELAHLVSSGTVTIGREDGTGAIRIGGSGPIDLSAKDYGLTLRGGDVTFADLLRISDNTTLTLRTAAIASAAGDAADLRARTLWLDARGTVGAADNPLSVTLTNLRGEAGGDLFVRETDEVLISGALGAGSHTIHLVSGSFKLGGSNYLADTSRLNIPSDGTFNLDGKSDTVAGVTLDGGQISGNGALASLTTFQLHSGTVSTNLSGAVGLNKTTDGTVILNQQNTYSGPTTILGGVLEITASDNRLGTPPSSPTPSHLVIDGGTLRINSVTALTLNANRGMALGSETGGTGTLETATDKEVIYNGAITDRGAGAARLVKAGPGILTLGGTSSYSGGTTVEQGKLQIAADRALGTPPAEATPGHLELRGELTATGTFELNAQRGITLGDPNGSGMGAIRVVTDGTLTYNGVITDNGSGADGLIKRGAGTLILGGENTYGGGTFLDDDSVQFNAGVIRVDHANALGTSGTIEFKDNATLRYGTGITEDLSSRIVTGPPTVRSMIDTNGNDVEFATPVAGGGRLEKWGTGTLSLTTAEATTLHVLFVLGGELAVPAGILHLTGTAIDTYGPGSSYGPASVFVQRATLSITGGTVRTEGSLLAGYQIGDTGRLDVTSGMLEVGLDLMTGGGVNATGNIGGGTTQVIVAGDFIVGFNGGAPVVHIGDAATISVGQDFIAGIGGGSPVVNISGAGTQLDVQRSIIAGQNGGSPTINISGGTVNADSLQHLEKGKAVVNLTGGILTVNEIIHRTASDAPDAGDDSLTINLAADGTLLTDRMYLDWYGTAPITQAWNHSFVIRFDGGLLKPKSAGVTNLLDDILPGAHPRLISQGVVLTGGAIIDTSGFDAAILRPLLHDPAPGAPDDGGLLKQGAGTLSLAANNTFTGPLIVANGGLALVNDASNNIVSEAIVIDLRCGTALDVTELNSPALAGTLILANAQTLLGTGTIWGDLIAGAGSMVSPGASPGVLHQVGDFAMHAGSTLAIQIGGNTVPETCVGNSDPYHDQYDVVGTVTLDNAILDVSAFNQYQPQLTDRYVIIKNDGEDPVTGTFRWRNPETGTLQTLDEGALLPNFLGSGLTATISYQAGGYDDPTGNDVVIFFNLGELGDRVWLDANANGIQDPNELGLNDVTVQLLDENEDVVAITTTANNATGDPGYYTFTSLLPGTYAVRFVLPTGYVFSPPNQGMDRTQDSDADTSTGQTSPVTIGSDETNLTLDAGLRLTEPAIAVVKAAVDWNLDHLLWDDTNQNGRPDAGELLHYTFTVTNTGNVTLTNVHVSDAVAGVTVVGGPLTSLDPGVSDATTFTASYTLTQADIDAGLFSNEATATGTPPVGEDVTGTDSETVLLPREPSITVTKTAVDLDQDTWLWDDTNQNGRPDVGELLHYTFTVTNTGNVTLTNVRVSDAVAGVVVVGGPLTSLAPGISDATTFTASYTLTQADIDAGLFSNMATATGTPPLGEDVTGTDSETVLLPQIPKISLVKSLQSYADEDNSNSVTVDDTLTYSFLVTNTGNVTLHWVTVSDPLPGLSAISPALVPSLVPGASTMFTASYTVMQADVKAGAIFNTATARGDTPGGDPDDPSDDVTDTDDELVVVGAPASLGNFVWHDLNANGIQDLGEPGVAGARVTLIGGGADGVIGTGGDDTHLTTVTDERGGYAFQNLISNVEYQVAFSLPSGYVSFTIPDAGGDDTVDSDADPLTGATPIVVLAPGEYLDSIDAGLLQAAAIGDRVWIDLDGDGIQDEGEPDLAGVTVTLTGTDAFGNRVALTTTTGRDGRYSFAGFVPGTYTVTVTNPGGFVFSPQNQGGDGTLDSDANALGAAAAVTVDSAETNLTVDAGLVPIVVLAPDKNPGMPQEVLVVNAGTGAELHRFLAYESDYVGGTRVAVADLDGDGIEEIITAPGRNRAPEIHVFSLDGKPVPGFPSFLAYSPAFTAGVHLTVADVNGDGKPDIITVPSYGAADVRVFLNRYPLAPAFQTNPDITFRAFPVVSIGGAVVAAGDIGSMAHDSFTNKLDGKAEIVVGTGGGTRAMVSVFEVTGTTAVPVQTFFPFNEVSASFEGGVSLDVAHLDQTFVEQVDDNPIPVIIAGMGVNGTSRIEVWAWDPSDTSLFLRGVIPQAFAGASSNAPVHVAAATAANGTAYAILAVQGPGGTSREIRRFDIIGTSSTLQFGQAKPLSGFQGPWFIATRRVVTPASFPRTPDDITPPAASVWTNSGNPHDVNEDGQVTPLDVLQTINYINANPGRTALPDQQFSPPRFFDTNADGAITAADALVVLNHLNRSSAGFGEGEAGELAGEIVSIPKLLPLPLDDYMPLDDRMPRHASSQTDRQRDQFFGAFARDVSPDTGRHLPVADERSTPALRFTKRWLDDSDLFDLEAVLEDIAAENVA